MTNFPTKREFDEWWKGKRDRDYGDRTTTCPIARYLREHGSSSAWVGMTTWGDPSDRVEARKLPFWAIRRANHFDLDLDERSGRLLQ